MLIGIDDISKTQSMVKFLSIFGSTILEGLQVYLIVTGLSQNIEDFSSEKNLTFFKRADSKKDTETLEDILPDFDRIMFRDSYDLISLSRYGDELSGET